MFSLSMTVQPQVTVPLSHLINVLHSLKSSVGSSGSVTCKSRKHKEHACDSELHCTESMWNLRELGISELGTQQLDELVKCVLPHLSPQETPLPVGGQTAWRTSHLSTHSFFHNKHGFIPMLTPRHRPSPLQSVCSDLQYWPVLVQSRGFKTLRTKTRRQQSAFDRPVESEGFTPSFMKRQHREKHR